MCSKLILITASFPYGQGESFLEDELPYLAAAFESVIILCQNGGDKSRVIPSNVLVKLINTNTRINSSLYKTALLEILLITRRSKMRDQIPSFKALYSYLKSSSAIHHSLLELTQNEGNYIVYSYWSDSGAIAAAMCTTAANTTGVTRCHGWDVYQKIHNPPYLPLRRFLKGRLHSIFPISKIGEEVVRNEWWGNTIANINVARLGVNAKPQEICSYRDKFSIITCSRLIPLKRIELLVTALAAISDLKITWNHIGDGPARERVENQCKTLSNNINVEFHGHLDRKSVLDIYKSIRPTVFINLSSSEGIPVSIMEAMSLGVPTIATDVGGTSEIVNDKNGILLRSDPSTQDIVYAIRKIHGMSDIDYKGYQNNAKETWASIYCAEKNYTVFAENLAKISME